MWVNQNVAGPIPAGLANLVQGFGEVVSSLSPLLSAAQALVEVAQAFFNPTTSPYAALVNTLLTELQAFNNDLFATGVYYLSVTANTATNSGRIVQHDPLGIPLLTPEGAIEAAINSLYDQCDVNRPQFSEYAEVCAIGLMATAPSAGQFLALIEALIAIFQLPDWLDFSVRLKRILTPICAPTPPIWQSLRLNSIQDLKNVQNAINNAINTCEGYLTTANNILQQLADLIAAKQHQLNQLQAQIQNLINDLRHTTGIFIMNLPPTIGGNAVIQSALMDCVLERSTNQYTIMTLIVGGGPSLIPVDTLRAAIL